MFKRNLYVIKIIYIAKCTMIICVEWYLGCVLIHKCVYTVGNNIKISFIYISIKCCSDVRCCWSTPGHNSMLPPNLQMNPCYWQMSPLSCTVYIGCSQWFVIKIAEVSNDKILHSKCLESRYICINWRHVNTCRRGSILDGLGHHDKMGVWQNIYIMHSSGGNCLYLKVMYLQKATIYCSDEPGGGGVVNLIGHRYLLQPCREQHWVHPGCTARLPNAEVMSRPSQNWNKMCYVWFAILKCIRRLTTISKVVHLRQINRTTNNALVAIHKYRPLHNLCNLSPTK